MALSLNGFCCRRSVHSAAAATIYQYAGSLGAAVLALTVALAAYVMVKFYGIIFLGQPREPALEDAHDANWLERLGLAWLALGCILIGVLPQIALRAAAAVTGQLLGMTISFAAPWDGSLRLHPNRPL